MNEAERAEYYRKREEEEQLQKMVFTHVCSECGGALVTPWDPDQKAVVLRCGIHREHQGFIKIGDPVIERFNRMRGTGIASDEVIDEEITSYQKQEQERRAKKMVNEKLGNEQEKALAPYYGVARLTTDQAGMIADTLWPAAPLVERMKAAMICATYGLNPLAKHLYLVEFKGKESSTWAPLLAIGATRLIASRKTKYSYLDGPRMMTAEEQERVLGVADPTKWWAITIIRDERGNAAPGYGNWPKNTPPYGSDKGNTPQNMAFIRSERNAFDRLLPGEMPEGIETMELQYLPSAQAGPQLEPGAPPVMTSDMSTEAQRRKIFASSKQMGYTNGEVHDIIRSKFSIGSTKDLTKDQASQLIEMLERGEGLPATK